MYKPSSDIATLIAMHRYCRPAGSKTERAFIRRYLAPLGAVMDTHRNYHVQVGADTSVIFSSHTDTVHSRQGKQSVQLLPDGRLVSTSKAGCLGADDTAGVWLMREMIRARVPGHYIFHYGEEKGCIGSASLAAKEPALLKDARIAIAFDRRGTRDIITHQCGSRTASDEFARTLAAVLNQQSPLHFAPDDSGLFTDTEQYAHLIPECTNIAIGYAGAHGNAETLETSHLLRLRDALCTHGADIATIPATRNPEDIDDLYFGYDWSDFDSVDYTLPMAAMPGGLADRYTQHFYCDHCDIGWHVLNTKYPDDEDFCPRCHAMLDAEYVELRSNYR